MRREFIEIRYLAPGEIFNGFEAHCSLGTWVMIDTEPDPDVILYYNHSNSECPPIDGWSKYGDHDGNDIPDFFTNIYPTPTPTPTVTVTPTYTPTTTVTPTVTPTATPTVTVTPDDVQLFISAERGESIIRRNDPDEPTYLYYLTDKSGSMGLPDTGSAVIKDDLANQFFETFMRTLQAAVDSRNDLSGVYVVRVVFFGCWDGSYDDLNGQRPDGTIRPAVGPTIQTRTTNMTDDSCFWIEYIVTTNGDVEPIINSVWRKPPIGGTPLGGGMQSCISLIQATPNTNSIIYCVCDGDPTNRNAATQGATDAWSLDPPVKVVPLLIGSEVAPEFDVNGNPIESGVDAHPGTFMLNFGNAGQGLQSGDFSQTSQIWTTLDPAGALQPGEKSPQQAADWLMSSLAGTRQHGVTRYRLSQTNPGNNTVRIHHVITSGGNRQLNENTVDIAIVQRNNVGQITQYSADIVLIDYPTRWDTTSDDFIDLPAGQEVVIGIAFQLQCDNNISGANFANQDVSTEMTLNLDEMSYLNAANPIFRPNINVRHYWENNFTFTGQDTASTACISFPLRVVGDGACI